LKRFGAPRAPGPLKPLRRFTELLFAWLALFAGSPGVVTADGSALLGVVGVAWWGAIVLRPFGPRPGRARLAEWAAIGLGSGLTMWWVWYVVPVGAVSIAAFWGFFYFPAGALVRARGRLPLGIAVALAWVSVEILRTLFEPPFGLGWQQLGHLAHHHLWLSGSARVWGIEGLNLVLAALAGILTELQVTRRVSRPTLVFGLTPLAVGVALSLSTSPPELRPGPRVLLVQPGFPQDRKLFVNPAVNFEAVFELTRRGIEEHPDTDLVCWGETMLFLPLFEEGVAESLRNGIQFPPWHPPIGLDDVAHWRREEKRRLALFIDPVPGAGRGLLPPGTSFAVGAEVYGVYGEILGRSNALVLYDAEGQRSRTAAKRFLVPGAESMMGLEQFEIVRDVLTSVAGYIPDFVAGAETAVFPLETRDGGSFRVGATVCFDNAYLEAYTEPTVAGQLDFHLVASNEAWYRDSCEMDQMLAFSRIIALATGRSIVRATNSGISIVIGPDGRELGRVRDARGRDRAVPGTLAVQVPVPADPAAGPTIYARFRGPLRALMGAGVLLAWLVLGRRGNRSPPGG